MIDVIVLDPETISYPVFTKQLARFMPFFKQISIISTQNITNGEWRTVATNEGIDRGKSEWILFLEQDFFFTSKFLFKILGAKKDYDAIGFWEANRLHPAFLLIKREWVNKTSRNFSPDGARVLDHFGIFSEELVQKGAKIGELEKDLGLLMREDWYHMQGLTHNYNLCRDGNLAPIFKRDEFQTYHKYARMTDPNLPDIHSQLGDFEEVEWLKKFLV